MEVIFDTNKRIVILPYKRFNFVNSLGLFLQLQSMYEQTSYVKSYSTVIYLS